MKNKSTVLILTSIFLLSLITLVSAIPNPAPFYCENMGYTYNDTSCIFSATESCELWAFFNGECGQDYVKDLACVESGDSLEPGMECCSGLSPVSISSQVGNLCSQQVGSWSICAPCGNNICDDEVENSCNCPSDCPKIPIEINNTNSSGDDSNQETNQNEETNQNQEQNQNSEGEEKPTLSAYQYRKITINQQQARLNSGLSEIENVSFVEDEENSFYIVQGKESGRLFFLFPISLKVESKINAETGSIISEKKPWWAFLAW